MNGPIKGEYVKTNQKAPRRVDDPFEISLFIYALYRFDELMSTESLFLLPPSDPRVQPLKEVCDRLVQALNDEGSVSFSEQARIERIRRKGGAASARKLIVPSATTDGLRMPYRPEVSQVVFGDR